jgi:uridine kinase
LREEKVILKPSHLLLARQIVNELKSSGIFPPMRSFAIGFGGESGSGKSVSARCLKIEMDEIGFQSIVLHQDDFFHLPPRSNHVRRMKNYSNVGLTEVHLDRMQDLIADFRAGSKSIVVPHMDVENDRIDSCVLDFEKVRILIVEGTYVLSLQDLDVRVFLTRNYIDTYNARLERNRDLDDPRIEEILAIEHEIIKEYSKVADIIVDRDYAIKRRQIFTGRSRH